MRAVQRVAGVGVAGVVAAAGLCFAPGCGGQRQVTESVNTGLAHMADGDPDPGLAEVPDPLKASPKQAELMRLAEESAANLQAVFDLMNDGESRPASPIQPDAALAAADASARGRAGPAGEPAPPFAVTDPTGRTPQPSPFEDPMWVEPPMAVAVSEGSGEPAEIELPPDEKLPPLRERIRDHTIVLVDLLRQKSLSDDAPFRAFLGLAAMEMMWPGSLPRVISPDGSSGELPPDQVAAIEALREFAEGVGRLAQGPDSPIEGLVALADDLVLSRPMRIRRAELCSRVSGFGQFVPLASRRFVHGRNHPAIIYTEVAPFAHRPATSSERSRLLREGDSEDEVWAVELSQEVQIYNDSDGLLVWSRPEQSVVEVSRNRRRDFFLVNEIVLPRSLSVGRYQMKVTMRDQTSGALDEAIIQFEVVADPGLARGGRE